jgi:hypothetical protein
MRIRFLIVSLALFSAYGCGNRYYAPVIWQGLPYPIVKSSLDTLPCILKDTIYIQVFDMRRENIGRKIPGCGYPAELIYDNALWNVDSFLVGRFSLYLSRLGLVCRSIHELDPDSVPKPEILILRTNIITPSVRGFMWMWADGIVEIDATWIKNSSVVFRKVYDSDAKDGDDDVPVSQFAAVTIEYAGKLVTATSLKRIADSLSVDFCRYSGANYSKVP